MFKVQEARRGFEIYGLGLRVVMQEILHDVEYVVLWECSKSRSCRILGITSTLLVPDRFLLVPKTYWLVGHRGV